MFDFAKVQIGEAVLSTKRVLENMTCTSTHYLFLTYYLFQLLSREADYSQILPSHSAHLGDLRETCSCNHIDSFGIIPMGR